MIRNFLSVLPAWAFLGAALSMSWQWLFVKKTNGWRIFAVTAFSAYLAWLFGLTLELPTVLREGLHYDPEVRLAPFTMIRGFLRTIGDVHSAVNFYGNILMFTPVGFCAPLLRTFKKPVFAGTFAGFLLSVFIEVFQLFVPRTTDIDDVIMNTFGAFLGALIWPAFHVLLPGLDARIKNKPAPKRKIRNTGKAANR